MIILSISVAAFALLWGGYLWWRLRSLDAPAIVLLSAAVVWFVGLVSLGNPRPATQDILMRPEYEIIAYSLDEPKAIYLWVKGSEPIAYRLPWNTEQARQLHRAGKKAKKQGTAMKARRIDGNMFNPGRWVFHAPPPKPNPIKAVP